MTDIDTYFEALGEAARAAAPLLAKADSARKNAALAKIREGLQARSAEILAANALDVQAAQAAGLKPSFVERLRITPKILEGMCEGLRQIEALPDPIGAISDLRVRPTGIQVGRMRVPLGVIGIIYESRPNVTVDAAALCLKSGNAAILRGGSEAIRTNAILAAIIAQSLQEAGLPAQGVQVVATSDRAVVGRMITSPQYIDIIVPRGGKGLIARLMREGTVPMIKHLNGICHTYVDAGCSTAMAVSVCDNAKTQRCAPCNAMETLLVHEAEAARFLPEIGRVWADKGVEMRCDAASRQILEAAGIACKDAVPEDWDTEYNAMIISIAVVAGLDEAIAFINTHGSHHTDAIITDSCERAQRFLREVDSSSVMVNASTRFADGFEYGLGAEIGISTDKLHARGPVGLEGLTSLKYIVLGSGQGRH